MAPQKIVILGGRGTLATQLCHYFADWKDVTVIPLGHDEVDITSPAKIRAMLKDTQPQWVINATAFLNAERCDKEPASSREVNFLGPQKLAECIREVKGTRLVHFSTDYVFDGKTGGYDEKACALPLSYYGLHKYLADEAILHSGAPTYIFRIASVIGAGEGKRDFIKALLGRVASGAPKLSVINDGRISISTPKFIASVVRQFITQQPENGLYNCVANGVTSWFDVARTVLTDLGCSIPIEPVPSSAFPTPALRPLLSSLKNDKLKAVLGDVPQWEDIVRDQIADLKPVYLAVLNQPKAA
jgi:dTDP-4-dehydrorhamnose reductase